jgi:hypothetical protein
MIQALGAALCLDFRDRVKLTNAADSEHGHAQVQKPPFIVGARFNSHVESCILWHRNLRLWQVTV